MDNIINRYASDTQYLDLSSKKLKVLPDLTRFIKLKSLYCGNNQLIELNNLPNTLVELYCGNNQLTKLNNLPNTLTILQCSNNQLIELNNLPNTLNE